jgi:hypothetical protein
MSPEHDGVWRFSISLSVELKCTSENGTSMRQTFRIDDDQEIAFP